jgi:choline monooxygenase
MGNPADLDSLEIDPRIEFAETPPGWFYEAPWMFERLLEGVLPHAWHFAGQAPSTPGGVLPLTFYPGSLDEPLLLVRDQEEQLACLSNACTHRGNLLVSEPCTTKGLRCRYHGRRFDLQGRFQSMPEFADAEGFPRPEDDLATASLGTLGPCTFAALDPRPQHFLEWLAHSSERLSFFPFDDLCFDAEGARTYRVEANWALYADNYLEGFHIPYVHPSLNAVLDYGSYRTELLEWGTLQVGMARETEPAFELPEGHPDAGTRVGAYYLWLFPTTMLNLYPWGMSLNAIEPLGPTTTQVRFLPFVAAPELREAGAGAGLDVVEQEDEEVVEATQKGVCARLYRRGRYSPQRERGVHHFHRLLLRALRGESDL